MFSYYIEVTFSETIRETFPVLCEFTARLLPRNYFKLKHCELCKCSIGLADHPR